MGESTAGSGDGHIRPNIAGPLCAVRFLMTESFDRRSKAIPRAPLSGSTAVSRVTDGPGEAVRGLP
jgi:hypothetical protein